MNFIKIVWAVLIDLVDFVQSFIIREQGAQMTENTSVSQLQASITAVSPVLYFSSSPPAENPTTDTVVPPKNPYSHLYSTSEQLLVAVTEVSLRVAPTAAFDNEIARLPYGTQVTIQKRNGRWAFVEMVGKEGWVLYESLNKATEVWPLLRHQDRYDGENIMTQRLRRCITDSFATMAAAIPLQAEEYVTYYNWRRGRFIAWPVSIGRVAGSWHRKLKGITGIHIDVTPHTGAIMEYVIDDMGYLAIVEAVSPEMTLHISSVGLFGEGVYTELDLEVEEWRELTPVFISLQ